MSQESAFEVSELVNRWLGDLPASHHEEQSSTSKSEEPPHRLAQEPETIIRYYKFVSQGSSTKGYQQ